MTAAMVPNSTAVSRVDEIAAQAPDLFRQAGFAGELAMAKSISDLRDALTKEVMAPVMALQGSPLGFLCDQRDGYSYEVVRECLIEAKMRGFRAVGNEFNIIKGRFYAAKSGLRRKVSTWAGLTEFRDSYEVPKSGNGGATVKCKATWKLAGVADSLEADIPVRVQGDMGADGILGKAERKLLNRVHSRLAGWSVSDGDAAEQQVIDAEATTAPPPMPPPARGPATEAAAAAQAAAAAPPIGEPAPSQLPIYVYGRRLKAAGAAGDFAEFKKIAADIVADKKAGKISDEDREVLTGDYEAAWADAKARQNHG